MFTNDFIDMTAADALFMAIEPITPPPGMGACATHDPLRFDTSRRQQAAFDGEPVEEEADYLSARAICADCPLLDACRRYAADSRDPYSFLAGLTAKQRSTEWNKQTEIAKRRLQVKALRALGAPTPVIAELVDRDPSLIRSDLRAIDRQAA